MMAAIVVYQVCPELKCLLLSACLVLLSLVARCQWRRAHASPSASGRSVDRRRCHHLADNGDCASSVEHALRFFDSPGGQAGGAPWARVSREADALQIFHHYSAGDAVHVLRAVAPFDAPAHALLACAREIDLMPTWNKFCSAARVLEDVAPTRLRVGCKLWMPLPFPKPVVVLDAMMYDVLETLGCGCLLIVAATPEPSVPQAALPPELRATLELPCEAICRLTPRADGGCDVETVTWLPARRLPSALLNLLIYAMVPWVFRAARAMLNTALDTGSPLGERIASGPASAFYGAIAARCAEARLLSEKGGEKEASREIPRALWAQVEGPAAYGDSAAPSRDGDVRGTGGLPESLRAELRRAMKND
jgi:hypothetical protein